MLELDRLDADDVELRLLLGLEVELDELDVLLAELVEDELTLLADEVDDVLLVLLRLDNELKELVDEAELVELDVLL